MVCQTWAKSYLPTKQSGFQDKSAIFVSSNPNRKPRWAEVGQTYIMIKGVFVRFGFDV